MSTLTSRTHWVRAGEKTQPERLGRIDASQQNWGIINHRPGTGVFRRLNCGRHHYGAAAVSLAVCHRTRFELHLQRSPLV